ncbi:hypothetical protein HNP38_003639 [Chryseobacterium defluvii]|uniref:Uncharacterized protein n=1 Tax=Chryseobacterium defluvii TaxID=160396 RepID=A0A840KK58_9FLAO|nr:hypothetical protein [Chryseobacterium defluvii]MBB4808297.1 hypothetical protein [Chryseobacterium defluvii]
MIKTISIFLILFLFVGCVSQDQKDKDQIKETVAKYWDAVKNNDIQAYNNLIYDAENYPGVTVGDLNFLYNHYNMINSKGMLQKDIKIKDTVGLSPNIKMKYIQYVYKKESDANSLRKPLKITLLFYKPIGYNKIYNPVILENHIGWEK